MGKHIKTHQILISYDNDSYIDLYQYGNIISRHCNNDLKIKHILSTLKYDSQQQNKAYARHASDQNIR
jgi:hypothetical protein